MRPTRPLLAAALAALVIAGAMPLRAQGTRETVQQMMGSYQPIRFTPPVPRQLRLSNGVQVFLLEDHALPQIAINITGRHGVANLPDSLWAAGWQADGLMRTGGTTTLSPDSVDKLLEFYALGVGFQTGQENSSAFGSSLARHTDILLDLLFDMMRNPRNDTSRIRETVAQVEESWRRRNDQPGSILNRAWLQIMWGDHPFSRSLATPEEARQLTPERVRAAQARLFCPDRFVIGVTGDFVSAEMVRELEQRFRGWGRCPAGNREVPVARIPEGPRVVLIEKDVNQSNIRMGHAGTLRVGNTPDYFAAQVSDFLLGGGGGFNSRLLQRVRSDSGFAYSVFSNWGADTQREDLFFAGAQTRANKTVGAIRLMRDIVGSMAAQPVTAEDVRLAQEYETNAYVFQFENASQIVGQQVGYVVDGLPANWFDLYLQGIQRVTPAQVTDVSRRLLRPDRLITVVVGNPRAFDAPLTTLGPVTTMRVEEILR
jgi:predicted Zn-dependent peptidase